MKCYYDLHIHSCLSPCAENDMTPNNIINMSLIKSLNLISVTDHNHCGNVEAVMKVAKSSQIMVIPGVEIQTKEEVHILCYFKTLYQLEQLMDKLEPFRLKIQNQPMKLGEQLLADEKDEIIARYPFALLTSFDVTLSWLFDAVKELKGAFVPAHINKRSNSIMSQLAFIPQDLDFKTAEIFLESEAFFDKYRLIKNSDAHQLVDISEPTHYIEINDWSIDSIFNSFFGV